MKKIITTLVLGTLVVGVLSGCGRKGPLEPPPSSMVENTDGKMVQKPKEDKPFFLDRLLKK